MTLFFVTSVGTAFLLASTTCNRNCFSSSSFVSRVLYSSNSFTPLSGVSLITRSCWMRHLAAWYVSTSFHWVDLDEVKGLNCPLSVDWRCHMFEWWQNLLGALHPSVRLHLLPVFSLLALDKLDTSSSLSSDVTCSENRARPTVTSDKYHKCRSRTDLAALPISGSIWSYFLKSAHICRSPAGASAASGASVRDLLYKRVPTSMNLSSRASSALVSWNTSLWSRNMA